MAGLSALPVHAEELLRDVADLSEEADAVKESVGKRKRPEFEPQGLLLGDLFGRAGKAGRFDILGSYVLLPKLELGTGFEDNQFRAERDKRSVLRSETAVELALKSDFARHALNVRGRGALGRHVDLASEDFADFLVEVAPRIDITAFEQLRLRGSVAREHLNRGDATTSFNTTESVPVRRSRGEADWRFRRGDLSSRFRYRFVDTNHRDAGGIDNDVFDSQQHRLNLRGGYELQEGVTLWLEPGYLWQPFADPPLGAPRIDSEGWQVLAGVTYDLSAVTFLEFGAGYVTRRFEDSRIDDIADLAVEAKAVWNARPLVTLEALLARNVRAVQAVSRPADLSVVPAAGAAVVIDTSFELAAFWDPRENLIVELRGGVHNLAFADLPGIPSFERTLNELSVRLAGRYLVNPNLHLRLQYQYSTLDSDAPGESFDANTISLTAILQL